MNMALKQNFIESEKAFLVQLIKEYGEIIENKKTDGATVKEKSLAWQRIVAMYNSQGFSARTEKQLKKLWENLKQKKRRQSTEERRNQLMNGGGPLKKTVPKRVLELVSTAAPHVDVELECKWDSTAVYEHQSDDNIDECEVDDDTSAIRYVDTKYLEVAEDEEEQFIGEAKKPMRNSKQSAGNFFCNDEKKLRIQKIKEAIQQQKELHDIRTKTANIEKNLAEVKLKMAMREYEQLTGEQYSS